MKIRALLLTALALGTGMLFIFFGWQNIFIPNKTARAINIAPTAPISRSLPSRINEEGQVKLEVSPIQIAPNLPLEFNISLNTHSVELTDDLVKQSVLTDDKNNLYLPVNWTGQEPGGHHRSGILTFSPLTLQPKFISLIIKDVGETPQRVFKWDLE